MRLEDDDDDDDDDRPPSSPSSPRRIGMTYLNKQTHRLLGTCYCQYERPADAASHLSCIHGVLVDARTRQECYLFCKRMPSWLISSRGKWLFEDDDEAED